MSVRLPRFLPVIALLVAACGTDPATSPAEVLFTSAPGSPTGSPTSATLGVGGGSVETADGKARVVIPAGALAADAQVTLTPITNTMEGGVGGAYRLELSAAAVAKAVTITLSHDGLAIPSGLGALRSALQLPDGSWLAAGKIVLEEAKKTISLSSRLVATGTGRRTQAANLSFDVAMFEWFHLVPPSATLKTGESLGLAIETRISQKPPEDPDYLAPIGGADEELAPIAVIKTTPIANQNQAGSFSWSASAGSVKAGEFGATFTAPGKVPEKNPVVVSARYSGKVFDGMQLVSNVRIVGGAPTYAGPVSFSYKGSGEDVTGSADLRFERFEDLPDVARYALLGGSFKATVRPRPGDGVTCDPKELQLDAAEGESNGVIMTWKQGSSQGQTYSWSAASKEREVSFTCRDDKGAAIPYTIGVIVVLETGDFPYTDPQSLGGVDKPLRVPLGSGTATWSFDASR